MLIEAAAYYIIPSLLSLSVMFRQDLQSRTSREQYSNRHRQNSGPSLMPSPRMMTVILCLDLMSRLNGSICLVNLVS